MWLRIALVGKYIFTNVRLGEWMPARGPFMGFIWQRYYTYVSFFLLWCVNVHCSSGEECSGMWSNTQTRVPLICPFSHRYFAHDLFLVYAISGGEFSRYAKAGKHCIIVLNWKRLARSLFLLSFICSPSTSQIECSDQLQDANTAIRNSKLFGVLALHSWRSDAFSDRSPACR